MGVPKVAFRREGVTSSRRCDVIACREGSFQASEGSLPKGSYDVIACREGYFMSDNSERESQSSPSPHTFSGEEFENGSHNEDLGTDGESTGFERVMEGLIVEGSRVGGEEQLRSSGGEAYREMQRNYVTLEACANRVLGITQAPKASASGRAGPSGCGIVVVASADVGIPIRVPLPKKNMMSLYDLESLKVDYAIPECVGLRLPILAEAARYPPEGCVMVFSAMYKHGLRLSLHPWVQMMLSRLGYAPGQYNPNLWCILHEVYIAWWLAKRGEPSFEQFMHLYSMSRQQGNFGWVQVKCRNAKERGYFIGQPPSLQKTWRNRWFFTFGDWECWPRTIVSKHVPTQFQFIGSVKCRPVSREEKEEIELVRRQVPQEARELKNIVTPALLLQSRLLQGMAEVPKKVVTVAEDSPKIVRREKDRAKRTKKQAKGAPSTAEGTAARAAEKQNSAVAIRPRSPTHAARPRWRSYSVQVPRIYTLPRFDGRRRRLMQGSSLGPRPQTSPSSAPGRREVDLARRHSETAKAVIAEAQVAIQERNALQLKVGRLERELKETARRLEAVEEARLKSERRRTEELSVARAEAVEEYQGSDKFKSLVLDAMVEEQYGWEKLVASGVPPPIPSGRESLFAATPSAEATSPSEAETRGGANASGGESTVDPDTAAVEEANDHADA
ncbi:unnamed protein product [Prunus armeniaca]